MPDGIRTACSTSLDCTLNLSITDTVFLLGLPMIMTTALARRWVFGAVLFRGQWSVEVVSRGQCSEPFSAASTTR